MATAAPHVKLLRQLASAKDDYLSGAFDITWDGAKATLYLVFGRPSHAVFETDHASIEGEAAIDALLAELPRTFVVSDWRRAMSPQETLSITIDELAGPFVRLAGSYADDPVTDEAPEWWSASDDAPELAFGIADFPLLPGGRPLWAETSPENVHLADQLADLPPSILILTGAKLRAAAVVSGGDLIDAVWIDADDQARGESAGMAILGATKGSLAGYALDDPRVAEALTMLWRLPLAVSGVELSWLDPASMLAAFRADGLDRVLVIDAPVRGIALFSRGGLVAVYSETQRSAVASPERLRSLLSQARGRLSVMERKPRPVDAAVAPVPANAFAFFDVPALEPEPQTAAEPDAVPAAVHAEAVVASVALPPPPLVDHGATAPVEPQTEAAAPAAAPAMPPDEVEAPPPPPPSGDVAVAAEAPAAPEAAEAPAPGAPPEARKPKRSWWLFGTNRRGRSSGTDDPKADAATTSPPAEPDAEIATFSGWSVRQQGTAPPPPWTKARDRSDASQDADHHWSPAPAPTDAQPSEPGAAEGATPEAALAPSSAEAGGPEPPAEVEPAGDAGHAFGLDAAEHTTAPVEQGWSVRPAGGASAPVDTAPEEASEPPAEDPLDFWGTGGMQRDATDEAEAEVVDAGGDDSGAIAAAESHDATSSEVGDADVTAEAGDAPSAEAGHAPAAEAEPAAEPNVTADTEPETEHDIAAEAEPATEHDVAGDTEPETEHDVAADTELETEHDIAAEAEPATEHDVAAETETEPAHEAAAAAEPEAAAEPSADGDDSPPHRRRVAVGRTLAPWSWPLAEPVLAPRTGAGRTGAPLEPVAAGGPGSGEAEDELTAAPAGDTGFFSRDDPVGSQYVDFDEVRKELVQIGIVWLGEANAAPVTALLTRTRSTIDDFVATIDTIRGLHLEGQDPASVQAMAREMHQQAAERLCGA